MDGDSKISSLHQAKRTNRHKKALLRAFYAHEGLSGSASIVEEYETLQI